MTEKLIESIKEENKKQEDSNKGDNNPYSNAKSYMRDVERKYSKPDMTPKMPKF